MSLDQLDQPTAFADYVGRTQTTKSHVDGAVMDLMSAILDRGWEEVSPDNSLPPLWHWLLFQKPVRQSQLGEDGHPMRGEFLPPVDLPRRMFAGTRTQFHAKLSRDEPVTRIETIQSVTPKSGRSGKLVFVTVLSEISGESGLAIREEQDIVYREAMPPAKAGAMPAAKPEPTAEEEAWDSEDSCVLDPVALFRFSCATGNSHRIHYDQPYATGEEGYPDLVVHGPLQAILAAEACRRSWNGRALQTFRFQGIRPAFVNMPLRICVRNVAQGASLALINTDRQMTLSASAT